MPIFMDRHDLPESVTAEEVARLHQEDLKIEHKFGCKGMTYWFDKERNTAFCLIQAPNKKALQDMHNEAHGAVANRIIEVEPSIVESFLGRIEDPAKARNTDLNIINDPAFRILMVVRFEKTFVSHNGAEISNSNGLSVHLPWIGKEFNRLCDEFQGTQVQSDGRRHLISFKSVKAALNCAESLLSALETKSKSSISEHFEIRIGLSSGLPFEQEEGLFKETIKRADRLCCFVKGKVIITSELKDLYESENLNRSLPFHDVRIVSPSEERFLNMLIDFIEMAYPRADLKVEHFSKNLGLSKAQLYRKVKGLMGKSLNAFVKNYRLEKAFDLLVKKRGNISEVAFDTGFNSPAYFSKCFSQAYKMLPSQVSH